MLGWLLVTAWHWPLAFSFWDEVGYVGEAKLLLAGRLLPGPEDVGFWVPTPDGLVPKYPVFGSLLLAPLLALTPKAVFALGMLSALALCWMAARVLRSWGTGSVWALLILAYPTTVIVSRTAMLDVPVTAFLFAAWLSLRAGQPIRAAPFIIALCLVKPTGVVLGGLLIGGHLLGTIRILRRGDFRTRVRAGIPLAALFVGLGLTLASNKLSTGHLWFAYDHSTLRDGRAFGLWYLPHVAPVDLRSLFLFPRLLIAGAWPYVRRREFGPLAVVFGFSGLMCIYYYVDFAPTLIESLVLAPRLLLPVIAFLLVGYAQLLADLFAKRKMLARVVPPVLAAGTILMAFVISDRHQRFQAPMGAALAAAQQIARQLGTADLATLPQTMKVGLMFPGTTRLVRPDHVSGQVVLCSDRSGSHRGADGPYSCDFPKYRARYHADGFQILTPLP